jgi:hypothetical protein
VRGRPENALDLRPAAAGRDDCQIAALGSVQ